MTKDSIPSPVSLLLAFFLFLSCPLSFTSEHVPREKRFDERNAPNTEGRFVDPHDRSVDVEDSFSFSFLVCARAPSRDSERRESARSMEVKFFTVSTC